MSKLGTSFLWIALVGAIVAGFAGYKAWYKMHSDQSSISQAETGAAVARKQAEEAKKDAATAADAQKKAQADLADAQSKVDDLNSKLTTAQKTADDATSAISQAKADGDKAKADLQHIKDVLGDMSPEDAKAAIQKANDALAANQSEQKILQDQLQSAQTQIATLKEAINRSKTGEMPPGISGKVTFVNRTWNFVVLNVGLSNGIVPNGELIVYHGKDFLGKVKVTSAESTTAVADILPDAKADIQVGDDVLN
jgi:uncharacterized coiled-coil protein SlyX